MGSLAATAMALLARRFRQDRRGVAAVEFALIALPLFMTIIVIFECAVQYFIWTSLDLAVQQTARRIRTGQVQQQALDAAAFKGAVCKQVGNLFGCPAKLLLKVDVVKEIKSATTINPVNSAGALAVNETYDIGKSGDFLLVQAFLPWPAFTRLVFVGGQRTNSGDYVLHSATLFRNEPF